MPQYFRQAFRSLSRSPGFTAVAVVMLALGIGMSASAFSAANALLLRALPFPDSDRIVRIFRTSPDSNREPHSPANFLSIRSSAKAFTGVAAYWRDTRVISLDGQAPEKRLGLGVSTDFFATLGIHPQIGRDFAAGEDLPNQNPVALITDQYWRERFSSDPAVIGRTLRIGVETATVIGVLPASFDASPMWAGTAYVRNITIWKNVRAGKWFNIIARLRPGVSRDAAQAELAVLAGDIDRHYPEDNRTDGLSVVKLASSDIDDRSRQMDWLAVALAVLVLVIACANLAGVQLARALSNSHEYAVRTALGAGRGALMAPLLCESVILSFAGGALGLCLAHGANLLVSRLVLDEGQEIPIDVRVLLFAFGTCVLTALAFGLAPAWMAARVSTHATLKENARGGTVTRERHRFKGALIVLQLAAGMTLVSAALSFGLGVKSALKGDFGWHPRGLYYGFLNIEMPAYSAEPARFAFYRQLRDRLRAIPGVTDAALATEAPLLGYAGQHDDNFVVEGIPSEPGREPTSQTVGVDPSFFADAGIPLRQGGLFSASAGPNDPGVVVINEAMARKFWPGQSAIGKRIRYTDSQKWNQVVGVVGNIRQPADFGSSAAAIQIYRPLEQRSSQHLSFVLKTSVEPDALAGSVRKAVAALNPDILVDGAGDMEKILGRWLADNDLTIEALGCFAAVGLLISLIGLYAVISQGTLSRRREIGIRIALGATSRAVVQLVLRQGARYLLLGLVLGFLGAEGVNAFYGRTMPELRLPGVPLQGEIALILCTAGLLACFLPARQASRTDPVIALRSE